MTNFIRNYLLILTIILLISGCGRESDVSLYESANAKIKEGRYLDAMNDFKQIINEFPESPILASVKFELGKMYQGYVVPNIPRRESMQEAIRYYREVEQSFPDSVQAINSLFMIAFLQANELNDYESAKGTYQEFMEKYPDHELALSADAELKNLGKTPEEILQEKVSQN